MKPPTYLVVLVALSCSASNPDSSVKGFYDHLNRGEYSRAKALHTAEARRLVDGQLMALAGGFQRWAEKETKGGTILHVEVLDVTVRGEGAHVHYYVQYQDGSTRERSVAVTKEDGSWKIGIMP